MYAVSIHTVLQSALLYILAMRDRTKACLQDWRSQLQLLKDKAKRSEMETKLSQEKG